MSSMIERVARAIATVTVADWDAVELGGFTKEAYVDSYWDEWSQDARAAIEAMMEPSDAMVKAWAEVEWPDEPAWEDSGPESWHAWSKKAATADYQAMLTAALADAPGEG